MDNGTEKVLVFAPEEYEARLGRLRAVMAREGVDVMLLFGQDSMFYFTGYDQIGYSVYQVLIVYADGRPCTYLTRSVDAFIVTRTSIVEDVRAWYDDDANNPAEMTFEIVAESGGGRDGRIGIETKTHGFLPFYYAQLVKAAGKLELVDLSDPVMDLRLEKSPAEIALMREAGRCLDAGLRAGFGALGPGVRECEVHAAIAQALYAAGAEYQAVGPTLETGPRTLYQTHGGAQRRAISPPEPVTIEIGACYSRYHAVAMRSASVGPPSEAQRRMHGLIDEAISRGIEKIAPGVPVREVAATINEVYERNGLGGRKRHVGYGIGVGYPPTWLDNLRIKLTDDHVLKPGMTFLVHTVLDDKAAGVGVALGDPVLVTETGCEILTAVPRDIFLA